MSWIVLCRYNRPAGHARDRGLESITSAIKVAKGVKITTGRYPEERPHEFATRADAEGAAGRLYDFGYITHVTTLADAEARYAPLFRGRTVADFKRNPSQREPTRGDVARASLLISEAIKDLGSDLDGASAIDLLADNFGWTVAFSRAALKKIPGRVMARLSLQRGPRRRNPVPPSSVLKERIAEASKLRRDFSGHDSDRVEKASFSVPSVALQIGECDGIMYTTVRDGVTEKYLHKFKKKSRPTLAASHDGKTLILLGGAYQFTDRGIVDDE